MNYTPDEPISSSDFIVSVKVPAIKEVEADLTSENGRFSYALGQSNQVTFTLSDIWSAVDGFLSVEFIGSITFGGLMLSFLCLSVVLAVYGMFRGSM